MRPSQSRLARGLRSRLKRARRPCARPEPSPATSKLAPNSRPAEYMAFALGRTQFSRAPQASTLASVPEPLMAVLQQTKKRGVPTSDPRPFPAQRALDIGRLGCYVLHRGV